MKCDDVSRPWTTSWIPVLKSYASRPEAKSAIKRACSASVSGRRKARRPRSVTNSAAQASSPMTPGSQGRRVGRSETTSSAMSSAVSKYCSASTAGTVRPTSKPSVLSSAGKLAAGLPS